MLPDAAVTRANLKTPKAAAIAGIVFSVLFLFVFWLFRQTVPADPLEPGAWLASDVKSAGFALNLIPIAGIAFLWFIGVLRNHLGQKDRRRDLGARRDSIGPDDEFGSIPCRPWVGIHCHERVCAQDGRGVHVLDIDCHPLHRYCAALDRIHGLRFRIASHFR
jgi:hypothetical protein